MEFKNYRYFAKDNFGRDLFFIELDNTDGLEQMSFITSLGIDLDAEPSLADLISGLKQASNSTNNRNKLGGDLIAAILLLPGIEQYFFPDYLLSSTGSYLKFADNVVNDIALHSNFLDFTPFSEEHHPLSFRKLQLLLNNWKRQGRGAIVDQSRFLELLPINPLLQELYVKYHSEEMEFIVFHFEDDGNVFWDIYTVFYNGDLKFAFSRK